MCTRASSVFEMLKTVSYHVWNLSETVVSKVWKYLKRAQYFVEIVWDSDQTSFDTLWDCFETRLKLVETLSTCVGVRIETRLKLFRKNVNLEIVWNMLRDVWNLFETTWDMLETVFETVWDLIETLWNHLRRFETFWDVFEPVWDIWIRCWILFETAF